VVALGGKAAETVFYGREEVSLGAVQDLKQANSMARRMIGNYGMGDELEVFFDEQMDSGRSPFLGRSLATGSTYSDKTSALVDKESLRLVKNAYSDALDILEKNQNIVSLLVTLLINGTTLTGSVVNNIVNGIEDKEPDETQ
jgi:cell division protease FtsH